MSFISKKDCRVGEFTDMKETILMNNNNWNSKFWENTGNLYLSVFSQYRPILSLPENGGKQCPKQIYKFKFDLDFLFFCVKGCVKGKCDYWNFDKILPFSLPWFRFLYILYIKLERCLPKNQQTLYNFLNFENWTNVEHQ